MEKLYSFLISGTALALIGILEIALRVGSCNLETGCVYAFSSSNKFYYPNGVLALATGIGTVMIGVIRSRPISPSA